VGEVEDPVRAATTALNVHRKQLAAAFEEVSERLELGGHVVLSIGEPPRTGEFSSLNSVVRLDERAMSAVESVSASAPSAL
jgi:hypothetical protein